MRRAAKRDAAEPAIVEVLRAVGASVQPLSLRDAPDLLVGYRGATVLLECKTFRREGGKDKVSDGQRLWNLTWRGGPVHIVHTPEEALAAIGYRSAQ